MFDALKEGLLKKSRMTNVETLTGTYNVAGSTLTQPGVNFKLVVTTRNNPEAKKTKHFLIAKPLERKFSDGSSYVYISSLFPAAEKESFKLDFEGKRYLLKLSGNTAEISNILIS